MDINFKIFKGETRVEFLGIPDGAHTVTWVPTKDQKLQLLKMYAEEFDFEITQNLPTSVGSVIKYPDSDKLWMLVLVNGKWDIKKWTSGCGYFESEYMSEGWEVVHHG